MVSQSSRTSLLCPNCRKLISGSALSCPFCGLKHPSSRLKNNIFTTGLSDGTKLVKMLITINVVMFVLSILLDPQLRASGFSPFSFLTVSNRSLLILGSTGSIPLFHYERFWTLLSANYLHGGLLHILFNMLAVRQLAFLTIQEYGPYRTISIYTIGGIAGFLISSLAGVQFTIGASAALCSLIGALLYYGKSRGGIYGQNLFSQIGGWAIGILLFGFLVPGINNWAHGGGILAGMFLGYLLGYKERKKEQIAHKFLSMICLSATGLALFWSIFSGIIYTLL